MRDLSSLTFGKYVGVPFMRVKIPFGTANWAFLLHWQGHRFKTQIALADPSSRANVRLAPGCSSIRQAVRPMNRAFACAKIIDRLVYEADFARCLSIWQRKAFRAIALFALALSLRRCYTCAIRHKLRLLPQFRAEIMIHSPTIAPRSRFLSWEAGAQLR
jgi:hypothetical protein